MFKAMARRMGRMVRALHADEQGADMVEYILIFAAVSLPLLGVLIWYWKDISKWASDLWDKAKGNEGTDPHGL
jgi:Flp pilus assembly pilin Flp